MRNRSPLRCVAVILVAAAFADSVAAAQTAQPAGPPPSRNLGAPRPLGEWLTGPAKEDYETARILFENGDYAGALLKFQHAYELSTDARLLWNMAACEKNLRHYVRVLRLVEQYLRDGGGLITDAQRADAAAVLRTVRSLVSGVRVVVNEPGASVYLDDALAGVSPLADPLLLDLGDHRIRVNKPGFKEQILTQRIVGATDVTVTVALEHEAQGGHLMIVTSATNMIQVDGASVGVGRWDGPLPSGVHTVRVTAEGMTPFASDVVLHEGETRSVDVTLHRPSAGISPIWWIVGGVVAAAGLGVGGYFAFHSSPPAAAPVSQGTITPGSIVVAP